MKVRVTPKSNFHHDNIEAFRGVPIKLSVVVARDLHKAGFLEDFDDTQTAEDSEAEAAEAAKRAEEAATKKQDEPANKAIASAPQNKSRNAR